MLNIVKNNSMKVMTKCGTDTSVRYDQTKRVIYKFL